MVKIRNLKLFVSALILCFIMSQLIMPAQAEGTLKETVGLSLSDTSDSFTRRVFVQDNELWVFSMDNDRRIGSETLIAALASSEGYTLSYCDADKNAAVTALVKDGYIKAEKEDSDAVYIPIVSRVDMTAHSSNFNNSESGMINNTNGYSYVGGIGGKGLSDLALAFDFTANPGQTLKVLEKNNSGGTPVPLTFDTTYTIEMSFFNDSSADLMVKPWAGAQCTTFTMKSDGSATVRNWAGSANEEKSLGKITKGQWHRLAITVDVNRSRFLVYLDGVQIADHTPPSSNGAIFNYGLSSLVYGAYQSGDTAMTGVAAWDDLEVYKGYYDADEIITLSSRSDAVIVEEGNGRIIVKMDEITSVEQYTEVISTNAGAVRLYTDTTFTQQAETLASGCVLVLEDTAGTAYKYFDVLSYKSVYGLQRTEFEFTGEDSLTGARAVYYSGLPTNQYVTMVMVTKNANGAVTGVYSSDTAVINANSKPLEILPADIGSDSAEVFFITDWTDLTAVSAEIIKK